MVENVAQFGCNWSWNIMMESDVLIISADAYVWHIFTDNDENKDITFIYILHTFRLSTKLIAIKIIEIN